MRSLLVQLAALIILLFSACSPNNLTVDNALKKVFDAQQLEGCFGLFDNTQGHFTVYNLGQFRDTTYLPDTTFTIVQDLIGIQTGRLKDEKDSLTSPIGQDTLKVWMDSIGYNPAKITSDEQLGLVKKLYFEQLPFFARTQQLVVKSLLKEDNSNYKLSYLSFTEKNSQGQQFGAIAGWIEENKHLYFFVLNTATQSGNKSDAPAATNQLTLLKSVLKHYGFMDGKK